jgi:hypothetical protein
MPEVERMQMLNSMIEKVRADLVKLSIEDIWPRHALPAEDPLVASSNSSLLPKVLETSPGVVPIETLGNRTTEVPQISML